MDKHRGGLIEFARKGFITIRMKEYETKQSETICTEFTVSKESGFVWVFVHHLHPII